jgi:hypothetical protein
MNTTIRSIRDLSFFGSVKKFFQGAQVAHHDDLKVCSSRESILALGSEIEGKNIPIVIHLMNGEFTRATVVKILNGCYLIVEESKFLSTTANLIHVKEIRSVSIRTTK